MKSRLLLLAIMGLAVAGCNTRGNTRPAPALAPQAATPEPAKRNLLVEVGETTVRIVQEPVRLVTPKKTEQAKPEVFDAPAVTINRRGYTEPEPTGTPVPVVPTTPPAPAPAP